MHLIENITIETSIASLFLAKVLCLKLGDVQLAINSSKRNGVLLGFLVVFVVCVASFEALYGFNFILLFHSNQRRRLRQGRCTLSPGNAWH